MCVKCRKKERKKGRKEGKKKERNEGKQECEKIPKKSSMRNVKIGRMGYGMRE